MKYKTLLSIINPVACKATLEEVLIKTDILGPSYEDLVVEFFRTWDREDKYTKCYSIGVVKMEVVDDN